MAMTKFCTLLFMLGLQIISSPTNKGFSQDSLKIDSLTKELNKYGNDTNKVLAYNDLAYEYLGINPEKTYNYAYLALALSVKLEFKKGIANSLYRIGINYYRQGKYLESIQALITAAKNYSVIGHNRGLAATYNAIGNVYFDLNDFDNAFKFQFKALEIQSKNNFKKGVAHSLNNIGNIYNETKNFDKALKFYYDALSLQQQFADSLNIALLYNNIGIIYRNKNNISKALEYYLKSIRIKEATGNKQGISISYGNIGNLYLITKDYPLALEYFTKSLSLAKESGSLGDEKNALEGISKSNANLSRYDKAYLFLLQFNALKDSIFAEKMNKQIIELQAKYESEHKENLINTQKAELEKQDLKINHQRMQVYFLIVGVMLLIVLSGLIFFNYKRKKKDAEIITKEKKRSDDLLLNILPAETAEELKLNGHSLAKRFDMVTVLFADFVGFTAYAETQSPENVVKELDFCFSSFDAMLSKFHIEKIKTIGDSYMCAGGVPIANISSPSDVIRCGIEMRDFIKELKKHKAENEVPFLELRIGIHTGPVVAGIVGVKKFAYDIWGDTVNTASRMESSGVPGKVNISGETYNYIKDLFNCEYRGKIPAKNKGDIDMYFVENL